MNKIILDSNAYSMLLTGAENVLDAPVNAETAYPPVFVPGGLYAGFCGRNKEGKNKKILDNFRFKPAV